MYFRPKPQDSHVTTLLSFSLFLFVYSFLFVLYFLLPFFVFSYFQTLLPSFRRSYLSANLLTLTLVLCHIIQSPFVVVSIPLAIIMFKCKRIDQAKQRNVCVNPHSKRLILLQWSKFRIKPIHHSEERKML